jgi:restriction endonuclease S subunit
MKKYDKYKKTRNIWFPELPSNWILTKVKYVARTIAGGTPSTDKPEFWDNGNIPWLPSGKLQNCDITTAEKFITEEGLNNSSTKWIKPNTTLIALTGATCANIGYLKFKACANQSVVAIDEVSEKSNSRFMYYMFLSMRKQILTHQSGGAQAGINDSNVKNLYMALPSLEEQTKIALYLDTQTATIDQLIQQKEKLIELLKEKRQTVINEAVTKGLNPDAKMKNSRIEWLGDVPEHWEVKKLKYLVTINSNQEVLSETPFKVALENIESGTGKFIESNSENQFEGVGNFFKYGDVLFNKLRPYLAKVYLAKQSGYSVGELLVLKPKPIISSEFLFYRLLSPAFIEIVNGSTYGAKMPRASWNFIGNLSIPVPNKNEQVEIVNFIEEFYSKSNSLIFQSTSQIEKLKEYRQSIISEAVIGKIDVRDWQPNIQQVA